MMCTLCYNTFLTYSQGYNFLHTKYVILSMNRKSICCDIFINSALSGGVWLRKQVNSQYTTNEMDFTCVIKLKSEYDSNFKLQKVAERTFNCNSLICAVIYIKLSLKKLKMPGFSA